MGNELKHYGILGMHWGKRKVHTINDVNKIAKKNEKLKAKLSKVMRKSDANKAQISDLTRRMEVQKEFKNIFSYRRFRKFDKKRERDYKRDKKFSKKMDKIQEKMEKNKALMRTAMKDLPKKDIQQIRKTMEESFKLNQIADARLKED